MPELAEVEYYRKQWSPGIGQIVAGVELHPDKRIYRGVDTDALVRGLKGRPLKKSMTHGKRMCFIFGDRHWLGVHLGMTGKNFVRGEDYQPAKHDHLVVAMESGTKLVFSDPRLFGRIHYAESRTPPEWWSDLPAEILSDAFTVERLQNFLKRRARAAIKAVLLMQEVFPGIGNWMADEILWRARLHPATPAGQLCKRQQDELYRRIREVSRDALEVIGSDWNTPPDDWLFNHRWRDGGICPKTGRPLVREKIGGRTTCWSPAWQK
ncbi:DNA-formamidopyrimidine glycosylase [Coraliomargarita sinensis]|uniref:DNA-formamidopyrimidine glycosylase n=2 Tax=Coraliomargarita sinensis TaxID=2174842 RepID=A0A317ZPH5_9BACT|nr:DNA-formamidopyrimidine glycosylase [Coraliomargarita sinensis]